MKIAIVKLSALGDIIHAMIVLQCIKKYNQKIEIDWIVEENYKELLVLNPDIHEVHVVNLKKVKKKKSLIALLTELNRVRKLGPYDLVVDLQGLLKSSVISSLIPSKITIGFDKFSIKESIASFFYNKTLSYGYDKNIIERNIALIEFAIGFNVSKDQIDNKLPLLYSSKKNIVNRIISNSRKNILIIPGASHKSKYYPFNKFAKVVREVDANFLIIWCSDEEKILAEKIKNLSPKVIICERLSLDNLIALIAQVNLVIGPDTGPTHMAWALNIPSITLFGSTPGYRNAYTTKKNRIIESGSIVDPFKIDKYDLSIRDIDVEEILKISKDLLNDY
jgi:heptosyltransferase I